MNSARSIGRAPRFGAIIALAALSLCVPASVAQTPTGETAEDAHPVHIHAGSCAELGDVVIPLTDVALPAGEHAGADAAISPKLSLNLIDMPLPELLAGEYAVNVHQSAEEIDVYIACGDLGGVVTTGEAGEELRFVLEEQNDSGHSGIVFLTTEGDQTEVNVMLIDPAEMS